MQRWGEGSRHDSNRFSSLSSCFPSVKVPPSFYLRGTGPISITLHVLSLTHFPPPNCPLPRGQPIQSKEVSFLTIHSMKPSIILRGEAPPSPFDPIPNFSAFKSKISQVPELANEKNIYTGKSNCKGAKACFLTRVEVGAMVNKPLVSCGTYVADG